MSRLAACCNIKIKPYRGLTYKAVKLQQPTSQIIISHTIYVNSSGRREQLELNERNRILLTMRAGPPLQQLPHGMYYFPEGTDDLREAKINEVNEAYLEKLGWYKKINGQWNVNGNGLPLRNAYKVVMKSCKGQLHQDQFIGATNYVLRGKEYFDDYAERPVVDFSYVKNVKIEPREVKVIHQHGTAASMYVKTDTRPNVAKSRSMLANFTGIISLDHTGNRMFNATFFCEFSRNKK
ncbi:unnamed protein product [Caenorhabditis auriculariae]|uniref:Uncharacterized protein n=1 Tax=Caenorhabditis auriculariae TaxID=2777116 RepID=A0A8S1HQ87_9PELO|nr:unnamed protein product [Caenorhabditis auriculariae]